MGNSFHHALARADALRIGLAQIDGVRVFSLADLPQGAQHDGTEALMDVSGLGAAGCAIDDWLAENHRVSVGLSDARHLLAIVAPGTSARDVRALVRGLADCAKRLASGALALAPLGAPSLVATLDVSLAADPKATFFRPAEHVALATAAGRIAAEIIAPAPPGVPRLVPGQLITAAHIAWLTANSDHGAFFLDPTDPSERTIRVAKTE